MNLQAGYFFKGSFGKKITIGLDIGAYSIKLVKLKETPRGYSLVKLGYSERPLVSAKAGVETGQKESLSTILRELWRAHRIGERKVRVAISDHSVYLRHLLIPRVAERELIKAIKWQVEKYLPFPVENAIVDFQTLDKDSGKASEQMEVVAVAVKRETVERYLDILKAAGMIPTVLDLCPFTTAKAFFNSYDIGDDELVGIVDIGAEVSSVIAVKGRSLVFVRNIEVAGNDFTKAISEGMSVDENEAQTMKRSLDAYSLATEPEPIKSEDYVAQRYSPKGNIGEIIKPVIEELTKEIDRSFAYCERELLLQKIDRVIACGGGAQLKGLDRLLAEKLGVPVEIGSPFRNIETRRAKIDRSFLAGIAPNFMGALGVALA